MSDKLSHQDFQIESFDKSLDDLAKELTQVEVHRSERSASDFNRLNELFQARSDLFATKSKLKAIGDHLVELQRSLMPVEQSRLGDWVVSKSAKVMQLLEEAKKRVSDSNQDISNTLTGMIDHLQKALNERHNLWQQGQQQVNGSEHSQKMQSELQQYQQQVNKMASHILIGQTILNKDNKMEEGERASQMRVLASFAKSVDQLRSDYQKLGDHLQQENKPKIRPGR